MEERQGTGSKWKRDKGQAQNGRETRGRLKMDVSGF
jgi:hypothetical protein